MQRLKLKDEIVLVVGLSSGNIAIFNVSLMEGQLDCKQIGTLTHAHDFGVNSIDSVTFKRSVDVIKNYSDQTQILIASGGDDQRLVVHNILLQEKQLKNGSYKVSMTILSKFKRYAHTSCVKGVLIVRKTEQLIAQEEEKKQEDRNSTTFLIKTASYDQRFKTWELTLKNHYYNERIIKKALKFDENKSKESIKLVNSSRNCLSDLNGICQCKDFEQ